MGASLGFNLKGTRVFFRETPIFGGGNMSTFKKIPELSRANAQTDKSKKYYF